MFYSPSYIIDELGTWLTSDQKKIGPEQYKCALAQIFKKSEEKSPWGSSYFEKHIWFVFGNGVKLLMGSLDEYKRISGEKPLSKAEFKIVNPHTNIQPLITKLTELEATVSNANFETAGSKLYQMMNIEKFKSSGCIPEKSYPQFSSSSEKIAQYIQQTDSNSCFRKIFLNISSELKKLDGLWS